MARIGKHLWILSSPKHKCVPQGTGMFPDLHKT